ncbi:hypothetical protein VP01_1637g2 [Puccinia sorghi]|uniref:Uncharacterized protein n=1 Tax=Puccinia sorghi TaxID=27349 RepID=A0A0L6VIM4_9BASI|nr:hypothetical protein VP01_1637g2 [Puccinia sorghi]
MSSKKAFLPDGGDAFMIESGWDGWEWLGVVSSNAAEKRTRGSLRVHSRAASFRKGLQPNPADPNNPPLITTPPRDLRDSRMEHNEDSPHRGRSYADGTPNTTLLTQNLPGATAEDTIHPAFCHTSSQLDNHTPQTINHPTPSILSVSNNSNSQDTESPQDDLLPQSELLLLKQKPLDELRRLQIVKEYVQYQRLNQAIKTEAEEIYHEYQKKIMLVAFKHQRLAVALSKYLGQGRKRESNSWKNYRALSSDVKNMLKGGRKEIGQQNKEIAKAWRCLDSKIQEHLWLIPRLGQMMFNKLAIEGFVGGTMIATKYLQIIVEEGDPLGGFHSFVAGLKKRICMDEEDLAILEQKNQPQSSSL